MKKENKKERKKEEEINLKVLYFIIGIFILFFSVFILINEYTLNVGEKVYLKTVPVDPRDLLRGDYVTLSYEIEEEEIVSDFIKEKDLSSGVLVYFILKKDENDFASLDKISLEKPENELFIKGRFISNSSWRNNFDLGIDKYFIPENRGYEIERLRVNIDVLVSIDNFGNSKIIDLYYNGSKIDFKKENLGLY